MDDEEISEHRYRFFSEKGVELAFEQDKILITLFTGIVAGLVALLVAKRVGFWGALCFLNAELSAVIGLGTCLMHMAFSAKVMALFAAVFGGDENVPNLIHGEELTTHALTKNRAFAQLCYTGQLMCLFWAALFAALGVVAVVWDVIGWAGIIVASGFAAALGVAVLRPLIWVYRAARIALANQLQGLEAGNE
ncbi:MAG TPA: hypothetical protein VIK18_03410 [Pirellulales bacterium]